MRYVTYVWFIRKFEGKYKGNKIGWKIGKKMKKKSRVDPIFIFVISK